MRLRVSLAGSVHPVLATLLILSLVNMEGFCANLWEENLSLSLYASTSTLGTP